MYIHISYIYILVQVYLLNIFDDGGVSPFYWWRHRHQFEVAKRSFRMKLFLIKYLLNLNKTR